jgi:hypothetical protein
MANYVGDSINNLSNNLNEELKNAISVINQYPENVLEVAIKLLNIRYDPNTIKEFNEYNKNNTEILNNLWLFSLTKLALEERQLLLKYCFWELGAELPTDKLYALENAITSILGWKLWEIHDPKEIIEKLRKAVTSSNLSNTQKINRNFNSNEVTGGYLSSNEVTGGYLSSNEVTGGYYEDKEINNSYLSEGYKDLITRENISDELCNKIAELADKLKSGYKKFNFTDIPAIFRIIPIEGIRYNEFIDKATKLFNKSESSIEQYLKILKNQLEWIDIRKNPDDYDRKYIYLTYKFYEDIKDIIDQYLPKKAYSESESKSQFMEELSKELKKLIEKHLTPEGFEFDINEVDNLKGKERIAGAYLRSELLNNPYEAIEKIYKVYYEKYFQYKPININIIGLETLRSRTIITKSEDWGEFKDKLCIFRGDLAGIIKHKVRRPILRLHKCLDLDKEGHNRGCGFELIRLYEPIERSQDYKIKCPECGREIKYSEPLFKDEEGEPVKLERDLTIAIIQLKETDEVYRVYLPYTPEINNMRDVEIVGILKTNHKGEYYIEGLSINPQKTINFNYDAFVKKVKDAGYDNALDYIKDKVFYEIKAILDKEGKNPTIDTLIEIEILASSHIYWDKNRDGHLKPETIDCLFIGSYGQGKSLTIEPLAKLHNTTEDMIRVDMPNIENLIGLVISRDNLKFYKKGIIPMNHNRPIFVEEMIDFILRVGNDIDLLKAGKTSGIWKREREGYNIPMIGISPWIGVGNIKDIDLMELWEIYHLKGFEELKEALKTYYIKKLLKKHDYDRTEAKEHAEKIVSNILGLNPQLDALNWLLSQILDFTLRNLRGMTDRIPLIYLLKPYTNEDWREIKLHTYKVKKLREDYNFIRQKNLEAYECSLFINYIKNRDIEFKEDALTTLWEIEERLRDLLRDNGLLKGYSDRLFNQIEYMAKAYAKLRFKNYVELEDVRDALKMWFKTILGVLLRIRAPNKVKELFKLVEEDAKETPQKDEELDEINKLIEESRRLSRLKREILNYMLQHPERTYTTVEIAEKFNISEETAERLLKELCNSGDLYNPEENLWRPL